MLPLSNNTDLVSLTKSPSTSCCKSSAQQTPSEITPLCWRIHLLKRDPARLPVLLLVMSVGMACVWLMFGNWLPVLAAAMLLLGSVSEYLFPIAYRMTQEGICQEALISRVQLSWKELRRCRIGRDGLLLTSLPTASRLDAFRGVLLRFAPDGQPGDRASLHAAIFHYAPQLLPGSVTACSDDATDKPSAASRLHLEAEGQA